MNFVESSIFQTSFLLGGLSVFGILHAQQPGVDCAPIQGQGWQGCAPIENSLQQPQAPRPPLQLWVDHWGAIATDAVKGSLGSTPDASSQSEAEQAAMADCRTKGGTQCKLQISFRNGCAAMVLGDKVFNVNSSENLQDAIQKGMTLCASASSNCHVYYSVCSTPQRIQ